MAISQAEINEYIQDHDVKFIKFSFCDVFGRQKIISVLPSVLPRAFAQGIAVDASRIDGFYKPGDSELFLFPDTDTISLLPWRPSHGRVARFYCHLMTEAGEPFAQDGRKILRDAVQYVRQRGLRVNFGAENDFYLFRAGEEGEPTDTPFDSAGFLDEAPEDKGEDVRRDICLTLEEMGIEPQYSQHISGPGQNRIDFAPGPALPCADNVITFRSVVKMMAGAQRPVGHLLSPSPCRRRRATASALPCAPPGAGGAPAPTPFWPVFLEHFLEMQVFFDPREESYERLGTFGAPGLPLLGGHGPGPACCAARPTAASSSPPRTGRPTPTCASLCCSTPGPTGWSGASACGPPAGSPWPAP